MSARAGRFNNLILALIIILLIPSLGTSLHAQSDHEFDQIIDDAGSLDASTRISNQKVLLEINIVLGPGKELSVINSTIICNITPTSSPIIRLEDGAAFKMFDSTIKNSGFDLANPGLEIRTSNIEIAKSNFISNYVGLSLNNISDVIIDQCNFSDNYIGVLLDHCENITFSNCVFGNNSGSTISLISSGKNQDIKIINSTIALRGPGTGTNFNSIELNNSTLRFINVTYSANFENALKVDSSSELSIWWYLNIVIVNKNLNEIGTVQILIHYEKHGLIFNGFTDNLGRIKWLLIQEKTLLANNKVINYTPIFIEANKKGFSKKIENFTDFRANNESYNVILEKKKEDSEDGPSETLYMICTCFIIIIVVFIIMMAINVQLMKRKLGPQGFKTLYQRGNKPDQKGKVEGEGIACSECGTYISEDVSFCPHCGEYFEGEEFTCPGCKAIVNEHDTSCPKCGRDFETKSDDSDDSAQSARENRKTKDRSKSKEEQQFCSECGAVVTKEENNCPGCGQVFESESGIDDSEKSKQKRIKMEKKRSSYRNKKGNIKTSSRVRKITAEEEAELELNDHENSEEYEDSADITDDSYICSMCGTTISEDLTKCPKCGTEFE